MDILNPRRLTSSARRLDRWAMVMGLVLGSLSVWLFTAVSPAQSRDAGSAYGLEVRDQDYRAARAAFHTKLLVSGPSPQSATLPAPPAGVTEILYPSDGLKLKAWITFPAERRANMPVVIFLHGGFAFDLEDFQMAEPFRQAGYVVVEPLMRGEDGQPGVFSMFYNEVDDVLAAADYVAAQPYADASHIYLAGHSVGGTMAMLSSMASPRFRAVVSMSGSPNQFDFISGSWARIAPFDLSKSEEFELRSPLAYATSLKSPTRLFYGADEGYFRASTRRMTDVARTAGLDVAAQEFPGDHFGAVPAEMAAAIAFFRQH